MRKILFLTVLILFFGLIINPTIVNPAFAQDDLLGEESRPATLLPWTIYKTSECEILMRYVNNNYDKAKFAVAKREFFDVTVSEIPFGDEADWNDILGCAIKTGDIKLWMIPFFIRTLLEFIIGLAGLLAVAGLVYGGYLYIFAGLTEDKEKGKSAIKNAIIGLVMTLTAWAIVNIVISVVAG